MHAAARRTLLSRLLPGVVAALALILSAAPTLADDHSVWIEVKKEGGDWQTVHSISIIEGETLEYRVAAERGITANSTGPNLLRRPNAEAGNMGVGEGTDINQIFTGFHPRSRTKDFDTIDDKVREADGIVALSLETGGRSGFTIGTPSVVNVIVRDNDTTLTLSTANLTVEEGTLTWFTVTADADLPAERDVLVRYFSDNGHTFDALGRENPGVIIEEDTRSNSFPVRVTDDDVYRANGEFVVEILEGPWTRGNPYRLTMEAVDNDTASPNVNGDDGVDANDALILYYAYSLRNDLGTGR